MILTSFLFCMQPVIAVGLIDAGPTSPKAPEWINDLIIYQMRVDQFTPEGTIAAAKNKLAYLQDLGITAVLLNPVAQFNKGAYGSRDYRDVRHIYYGVQEPDKLEPLLGNDHDLQNFVAEAHRRGIKVFIDVPTSGVMSEQMKPLAGNWGGGAVDTPGLYNFRDAVFYLRKHNSAGSIDISFDFGSFAKQFPLAGDWDGDGKDTIGLYEPSLGTFYLKNSLSAGNADISIQYGAANAGWLPLAGDWDGDDKTEIGLYDPWNSKFSLKTNDNLEFIFLAKSLSSFTKSHSEWFKKDNNGNIARNVFDLDAWDYSNSQFRSWWMNMIVNEWILKFDLDGLRLDLEPDVSNFSGIWSNIRQLVAQAGKNVILFSEGRDGNGITGDNRHREYDFTEWGFGVDPVWGGIDFLNGFYNIANTIKNGKFGDRYYTSTLSYSNTGSVDSQGQEGPHYNANGNLTYFAYGMLLSPFIPVWYMGEEFNNECLMPNGLNGLKSCQNYTPADLFDRLYFVGMQWNGAVVNKEFLEKVKKIIQIRKENIDIVSPPVSSLSQVSIVAVDYSGTDLAPYVLFNNEKSIVVIGKKNASSGSVTLDIPLSRINLGGGDTYSLTNLMDGTCEQANQDHLTDYRININAKDVAILKIVKNGHCASSCAPKTCAALGNYRCGSWDDGCGNTLSCGACTGGKTCSAGQCVSNCSGRASKKCDGNNLYWYNSCNTKEELAQNCVAEKKICQNGACVISGGGSGGGGGIVEPEEPKQLTRAEILQKIAEVKQLLIQLIIQLIAELQKQLAAMPKMN